MPEENQPEPPPPEKTLEMRVAALEDKMSKISITEEEWKAYQKVARLLGQCTSRAIAVPVGLLWIPACGVYQQFPTCGVQQFPFPACGVYQQFPPCGVNQQGAANPPFGEGGGPATGFGSLGS